MPIVSRTPPIVKSLLVVSFCDTILYGFDHDDNAYILAARDWEGASMQTPEAHPLIVTLSKGLALAGVDIQVHFLNPDGETLYFAEKFTAWWGIQTGALSNTESNILWDYFDQNGDPRQIEIEAEELQADLNREPKVVTPKFIHQMSLLEP
jgi:hypothetical protein